MRGAEFAGVGRNEGWASQVRLAMPGSAAASRRQRRQQLRARRTAPPAEGQPVQATATPSAAQARLFHCPILYNPLAGP